MLKRRHTADVVLSMLLSPVGCAALVWNAPPGDANAWLRRQRRELCLLPFPMGDGLLPGESLQIHLSEPHQISLFQTALLRFDGCVGQMLERTVSSEGVKSYCTVAPLLELREHSRREVGTWCSFTCVGAVQLSNIELRTAEEQAALDEAALSPEAHDEAEDEPFLVATASWLHDADASSVDYDSTDDEVAFLATGVARLHEECNALRRRALELNPDGPLTASERITTGGERIGPPPPASDRVEFGYRLGPLIGPYLTLDELVQLRLDALSVRGVDEAPPAAGQPNRLHELWGAADGESLRRRLLSFLAVESLHESYRMSAMAIEDTSSRLQHALTGLEARKAALAAEVALRRAGT